MTGRIQVLATVNKPGRITTNTGVNRFHYAYRLPAEKPESLAVGRLVSFELEKSNPDIAIGVCARDDVEAGVPTLSRRGEVRYQGFEQKNGVRWFKFQAWRTGEENEEAIVTAELSLFRKYGITIQEGPALCLRFLEAELQQPSPSEVWARKRALTDKEMMAHVAARPAGKRRS